MAGEHPEPVLVIPARCVLGEGPVWDARLGCLWFTDIQQAQLLRWHHALGKLERFAMPERLGSLGLTADPAELVCALESGFALIRPETAELRWLHRVEAERPGIRMNDGRVDRQGRFWAGSMVEDEAAAGGAMGALYRLDGVGGWTPDAVLHGIAISNSLCFSPGGDAAYFADTPTREIRRFALGATGQLEAGEIFASLPEGAYPDGSDVDAAGRLWNAEWGAAQVTAYTPAGEIFRQLGLPVSQPTCIAFGGEKLDLLFVTSAREGLAAEALAAEPHAGDVLVYQLGITGLPAPIFRG